MLSIPHMIVVFIVVLIVFGPQKLPELAKGLGKLMAEFRKASTEFRSAFEEEMREMERQAAAAERKKAAESAAAAGPTESAASAAPLTAESTSGASLVETGEADAPMISPVPESIPRATEEQADARSEPTAVTTSENPRDTRQPA